MNILYQNIKKRREELGLTQDELAKKMGYLHRSSINKIELGINDIPNSKVREFADALRTTVGELMGYDSAADRSSREIIALNKALTKVPLYDVPISAGAGQWLAGGHEYEFAYVEDAPSGADFVLRVRGDSMSPMYCDDDIVFIKTSVIVESGQTGVFCLNGEGYLKMLQGNRLVSLNSAYAPIAVGEFDSFFCAGRVIGKARLYSHST